MKYNFNLTTKIKTKTNEGWSDPQLIKDNIDGCVPNSFITNSIYIESWGSDCKNCKVEIEMICGGTFETGESKKATMGLLTGSVGAGSIKFASHIDIHSVWIRAKCIDGHIVNLSGYVEAFDAENMPVVDMIALVNGEAAEIDRDKK